uniref:PPPDE domain-containing protein n=1 Tax=Ditylenchus dipsaci TaxID=166011 RepID=A0A915D6G8_9BILA
MARTPVRLNIYDMYWLNEYASNIGVGVFHSGIEVYGVEYAYGGHPFSFSGVFENSPCDANELGEQFTFRESISLGETDFSGSEVRRMVQLLGQEYRGDRYHLISKNCNHFTAVLAKTLTGQDIPNWINRLASISGSIPFLERWIPQEWLTPIALQQSLDKSGSPRSNGMDNGMNSLAVNTPLDEAKEVFEETSTGVRKKLIPARQNGKTVTAAIATTSDAENSSNGNSSWKWFRRSSADNTTRPSASAPNSARGFNNPSPSFSRIWNSIKSMGGEDSATSSRRPSTSSQHQQQSSSRNGAKNEVLQRTNDQ